MYIALKVNTLFLGICIWQEPGIKLLTSESFSSPLELTWIPILTELPSVYRPKQQQPLPSSELSLKIFQVWVEKTELIIR